MTGGRWTSGLHLEPEYAAVGVVQTRLMSRAETCYDDRMMCANTVCDSECQVARLPRPRGAPNRGYGRVSRRSDSTEKYINMSSIRYYYTAAVILSPGEA